MRRLRNAARKLAHSTSGTAVVETGIVAPILAILIMGIVDVASYGAEKLKVQQAINRGLELAMMGGPDTSPTSIQAQTAAQAGVETDQVTVTQSQTCGGTAATWGTGCATGQEIRRFIQIGVTQSYTPNFAGGSLADFFSGSDGPISISATGVIRVE